MAKIIQYLGIVTCCLLLAVGLLSCTESRPIKVRIALSPWPGYEMIYLAHQKGFFLEQGVDVELLEFASLSDANNAFLSGAADVVCQTLFELVGDREQLGEDSEILAVVDYSYGADVLVAREDIKQVSDLSGRIVGIQPGYLGEHILMRALAIYGVDKKHVTLRTINQAAMDDAAQTGAIDGAVTYMPFLTQLEAHNPW